MLVLQRPAWDGEPVRLSIVWTLTKEGRAIQCVLYSHQFGWELRMSSANTLVRSQVCRSRTSSSPHRSNGKARWTRRVGMNTGYKDRCVTCGEPLDIGSRLCRHQSTRTAPHDENRYASRCIGGIPRRARNVVAHLQCTVTEPHTRSLIW